MRLRWCPISQPFFRKCATTPMLRRGFLGARSLSSPGLSKRLSLGSRTFSQSCSAEPPSSEQLSSSEEKQSVEVGKASLPGHRLVEMFTHSSCSLCGPVDFLIRRVQARRPGVEYRTVNIHDPANKSWFDLYRYEIPVVHVDGVEVARHKLEEQVLLDALDKPAS